MLEKLEYDTRVAQLKEGNLILQVTVRGKVVMLSALKEGRGVEVALSPACATDLASFLVKATQLLEKPS